MEVGPGGGPFLITLEIEDSIGGKGYFTCYWVVETPPIIFATPELADGQAGKIYSQQIYVAEGVPPFAYEFVSVGLPEGYTSDKSDNPDLDPNTNVIYNPGAPPTVTPAGALVKIDASTYPSPSDPGPAYHVSHQGMPPEGILLNEETGGISATAPSRGVQVHAHVDCHSSPTPWTARLGTLRFAIVPAAPLGQDPAYTLDRAFSAMPPYTQLQEAMTGQIYNPDGGPKGVRILGRAACPTTVAPTPRTRASRHSILRGRGGIQVDPRLEPGR